MTYTIQDLRDGKCAVVNDGTVEELKKVLKKAFPNDKSFIKGMNLCYFSHCLDQEYWQGADKSKRPKQSVHEFLKQL